MSDTPGGPNWFQTADGKWYPPAPVQKKRGGCLKGILIGFAVIVGLIIIAAIAAGNSSKDAEKKSAASCAGKTFPDQQKKDICADGSNKVVLHGMEVTATPFVAKKPQYGDASLCTTVTIHNTTSKSQDYNVLDFKVQTPTGDVASTSVLGIDGTLNSGTLIAGATKTGDICTDDKGEKGQYVFIYKPNAFESDRGIWLFNV